MTFEMPDINNLLTCTSAGCFSTSEFVRCGSHFPPGCVDDDISRGQSKGMHEILTLQFGPLANFVGTHFWNTQESYFTYNSSEEPSIVDHDVNFRPGIGSGGTDTYTPRALIYDLKSGFGSLKQTNALYETETQNQKSDLWTGEQRLQTALPVPPSPYQEALESGLPTFQMQSKDVRYWSDYNRVYFHPRSLVQLSPQALTSQLSAFDSHAAGIELYENLNQEIGGIFDRDVRPFAEECDTLQGFQVIGASDNAWGGFMTKYMEELEEDFGKKSVWVWGLEDGQRTERIKQLQQITNSTQTLADLADKVSAYIRTSSVPSTLPSYISLDPASSWSTGALIASVIESVTLPTRLRAGSTRHTRMAYMEDLLHGETDRKIWSLTARANSGSSNAGKSNGATTLESTNGTGQHDARLSTHLAKEDTFDVRDEEENISLPSDLDFTPMLPQIHSAFPSLQSANRSHTSPSHLFTQIQSHRSRLLLDQGTQPMTQRGRLAQVYNNETIVELYQTPLAFPLLDSFPQTLFAFADHNPNRRTTVDVAGITGMTSGERPGVNIDAALSTDSRTKIEVLGIRDLVVGRGGRMMNLVDSNDRETIYDGLTKLAESYSFGYEDDFSDDEDGQDD